MPNLNRVFRLWSIAVLMLLSGAAQAGLGSPAARLQQDRVQLGAASTQITHLGAYDKHAMVTSNGVGVRAYSGRDGRVFAVTFNGPAMPDLKVLLGDRFGEYAAAVHPSPTTHKVYTHSSSTLELSIVKLPRGFTGSAYVPGAVPTGVDPHNLQ
jgi:hypothetical protein